MNAAILSIGSELMEGRIADTNAAFLSDRLTTLGFRMDRHVAVGDRRADILAELRALATAVDVVVVTGGIGPTPDDPTRQVFAEFLGVELVEDAVAADDLRALFARRNIVPPASNFIQARIPAGAELLRNPTGTAAGFSCRAARCLFFSLPGVPSEMKVMYRESIEPALRRMTDRTILVRALMTFGMPESLIGEKLREMMTEGHEPAVATQAHEGVITVRITATDRDAAACRAKLEAAERDVRARLGDCVYGVEGQSLAEVAAALLRERGLSLAVAESCTGGNVAAQLTDVPGISACLMETAVTYSNASKTRRLGVAASLIEAYGAVSPEVARAMAAGMRLNARVDLALATTGIAGPTGATPEKPVGLVYVALAHAGGVIVEEARSFGSTRTQIKDRGAKRALNTLRLFLENSPHG
jgi:nicotinamide-nucleotide amidase